MKYGPIVKLHNAIDGFLKFPNLRKGEVGVQIGFDMSSGNLTSDIVVMGERVGKTGMVIGIDPDPFNLDRIRENASKLDFDYKLVQKGTYSEKTNQKLVLAKKASWNVLESIENDKVSNLTDEKIEVGLDTLDSIIEGLNIEPGRIGHVNITNNGAEFATLLGMEKIMDQNDNLAITVIAGRPGKMGEINGRRDDEVIMEFLKSKGFDAKLFMKSKLLWWGPIHQGLMKGRPYRGESDFGVVMAGKGNKRSKWYQSFS